METQVQCVDRNSKRTESKRCCSNFYHTNELISINICWCWLNYYFTLLHIELCTFHICSRFSQRSDLSMFWNLNVLSVPWAVKIPSQLCNASLQVLSLSHHNNTPFSHPFSSIQVWQFLGKWKALGLCKNHYKNRQECLRKFRLWNWSCKLIESWILPHILLQL